MTEREAELETARRVRALRKERQQTQIEVAQALGIWRTSYCQIEHAKRGVGALELAALCLFWRVPYAKLFVDRVVAL